MNNNRDLLKRMLRLYPAKLVKEYFQENGNATDAIEAITVNKTQQAIKTFVKDHQILTRQHIYFYTLGANFNLANIANFPFTIESQSINNGEHTLFCLPKVTYKVTLYNPLQEDELEFLQPVVINVTQRTLIIHITKIEKTVGHYYQADRGAVRQGQTQNEIENLTQIANYFDQYFGLTKIDCNRGIKDIWDRDLIDSKKVQWRNNASTDTVTMDEDFTLKEKYPNKYVELVNDPLVKTMFKYLRDDNYLCDAFDADPSNGVINIPKFPQNANQVKNVITEILTNN
jgi:hypothetical protein